MAFDVVKWLKEDLAVADEAVLGDLSTRLAPLADRIEKGYLRQSDYSKSMNALTKSQADLDAANTRLNAEMAEWATVQANGETITKKMRDDLDAAQLKVTQLTSRVQRVAIDAGLDPAKALEGIEQPVEKPTNQPPAIDLTGYAKRDDISGLANMALTLPAELQSIADEHFDLTGKRLDTRTIVREIQARAGTRGNQKSLDPREIWEQTHAIPDMRATKLREAHDAEIKAAEERGRQAAVTEFATPGSTPQGRTAPVFHTRDGGERTSVLKRPQPGQTVNAAVAAMRSGKYRTPGSKSA